MKILGRNSIVQKKSSEIKIQNLYSITNPYT